MELTIFRAINERVNLYITQDTDIDYLKAEASREILTCSTWTISYADFKKLNYIGQCIFNIRYKLKMYHKYFHVNTYHVNISSLHFGTKSKLCTVGYE